MTIQKAGVALTVTELAQLRADAGLFEAPEPAYQAYLAKKRELHLFQGEPRAGLSGP